MNVQFKEVASFINGYPFKPSDWSDTGLPIIRIQDLTGSTDKPNHYEGQYPKKIEVNDGDILISWSASLGVYRWNKGKALLNQHIFKVDFNKKPIDRGYFVWAVEYKLTEMKYKTHGSTMKHIVKGDFDAITIPYPSISDQANIALQLDNIKRLISAKEKELSNLDCLVKSRFMEMFGNKNIPMQRLGDLSAKITKGSTPTTYGFNFVDKGINFIKIESIDENHTFLTDKFAHINNECHNAFKRSRLDVGDILFSIAGALGRSAIVTKDILPANTNQALAIIKLKENAKLSKLFLISEFDSSFVKEQIEKDVVGAAQKNISLQNINDMKVIVPPIELQNRFADFVHLIDKSRFVCHSRNCL